MSEPVIRWNQVSKHYQNVVALHNFCLEIPRGTVFALLGENGAGKSTAIRMLLGLIEPDCGTSSVLGLDSRTQGLELRRQVGYVSDQPTLYEWMTIDEIGWFAAGFYGDGYLERYQGLAHRFGLQRAQRIKGLSKGTRAKVALALAMAHDPQVLILDEPTSGLDTIVRREFLESMVEWAAQDRTVLLASHQIHEVERVADSVALLRGGHLLVVDQLEALKDACQEVIVTTDISDYFPHDTLASKVLDHHQVGRQWHACVRGGTEGDWQHLRQQADVRDVQLRRPHLEEIYVAYMRHAPGDTSPTLSAALGSNRS